MIYHKGMSAGRTVLRIASLIVAISTLGMAQGDRGAIAGRLSDPAGAVIPGVQVTASNVATGAKFQVSTTETGDYTIPALPAGTYTVNVQQPGFRAYEQSGLRVNVAQTVRVDVQLTVGGVSETVEVSASSSLLKTESAEQSTTVQRENLNDLPMQWAGQSLVRDPLKFAILTPGVSVGTSWGSDMTLNGLRVTNASARMDGMDAGSAINMQGFFDEQPSVDAMEEFTIQTNNFKAEYGQVGSALVNMTARSGTNKIHGSLYDYFVNEAFNAAQPFQNNPDGSHTRLVARQQDFGGNVGGPVWIPKLYNGTNKTFFFFNWEQARNVVNLAQTASVPSAAMRNGDYSYYLTGKSLGTDGSGRNIPEGQIYDPWSDYVVNGKTYRNPVPNNNIAGLLGLHADPVAAKILSMVPQANVSTVGGVPVNNFQISYARRESLKVPSIKVDQNLGTNVKLSFFYTAVNTNRDTGPNQMPYPMNGNRHNIVFTKTFRFNYDHTLSPTLFNHLGIGYRRYDHPDIVESTVYDSTSSADQPLPADLHTYTPAMQTSGKVPGLGLPGALTSSFPVITGLPVALGAANGSYYYQDRPTVTESLAWARGTHMFKFGAEWKKDTFTNRSIVAAMSTYGFSANQTGLPATEGQSLSGGSVGNVWASFAFGLTNSTSVGNPSDPQWRRHSYALFLQDTWRVTQRLTLDYGLRWDYQPGWNEMHDRVTSWSPTTPIPSANNLMGGLVFQGTGSGRCNCTFGKTYPYAIGPRLGAAYKLDEKTVLRAGAGLVYASTPQNYYLGSSLALGNGWNSQDATSTAYGQPASILKNGIAVSPALYNTNFDPGLRVLPGQAPVAPPPLWDKNLGRPPRLFNWNIGLQREINKDLIVEAAYVGSRGAWFLADGLQNYNAITPEYLQQRWGLDVHSAADRTLLTSRIDSPLAASRGFKAPYPGFAPGQTVMQSVLPYPMYTSMNTQWAPLGNSWYDSLQAKVTKRSSHGYTVLAAYTYSKTLADFDQTSSGTSTWAVTNVWNRGIQKSLATFDQPHLLTVSGTYKIPKLARASSSRLLDAVFGEWQLGAVLRYASGLPIASPTAQNALSSLLFQGTVANRVPGQPLFLSDPNSSDPNKAFVLNRAAWSDPAPGDWGTAAKFYSDYRGRRRPDEQFSVAKSFKFAERVSLNIRFELFNAFNRLRLGNPTSGNALATQTVSANGTPLSGFGYVNPTSANGATNPRTGQIVARLTF